MRPLRGWRVPGTICLFLAAALTAAIAAPASSGGIQPGWPQTPGAALARSPASGSPDAGRNAVVALLSSGYVTPQVGDVSTRFTWRIKYWHTANTPPTQVRVAIWSSATGTTTWPHMWAYDPSDTNCADGKWYTYSCYLKGGDYAYRFAAEVGGQWIYWPQSAGSYQSGPQVNAVALSSGYVAPTSGGHATSFAWRIKYWNGLNLPADEVWCAVWWDSRGRAFWHRMWAFNPADTNSRDGKWYTLSLRWLDSSAHAYRFAARQGSTWAYWPKPPGSYRSGPTVGLYDFDGDSIRGPYVIKVEGAYLMAYDARGALAGGGFSAPSIGIATSSDGINWNKYAYNPVIPSDSRWPCLLYEPDDLSAPFKMWYNVPDPFDGRAGGFIKYATSHDGFSWTQVGTAFGRGGTAPLDGTYDDFDVAAPSVLKVNGTYYMYYSAFSTAGVMPICLATSTDALNWTKVGPVLYRGSEGTWDSDWVTQEFVFFKNGQFHMWYRGSGSTVAQGAHLRQIGYAVSDDGLEWTKSLANPVVLSSGDPEVSPYLLRRPTVVDEGSSLKMWFSAEGKVWHAVSPTGSPIEWSVYPDPVMAPSLP